VLVPIQILDVNANVNDANLEALRYGSVQELQSSLDDVLISLSLLHKIEVEQKDRENFIILIDNVTKAMRLELKFQMTFKDSVLYNIVFSKKQMAESHRKPPVEVFFEYKIKERPLDRVKEYVLDGKKDS
jgi:nitrate reductase NapAB chaperone NapD